MKWAFLHSIFFKFNFRVDTDKFKDTIGIISIEILKAKYKNFTISARYRSLKANIEIFKDCDRDFHTYKKTSGKSLFIVGDLNIHALDCEIVETSQKCLIYFLQTTPYLPFKEQRQ